MLPCFYLPMASDRRPLKSRSWPAMHSLAAALARLGVSPNQVSIAGMLFGIAAGLCLAATSIDTWGPAIGLNLDHPIAPPHGFAATWLGRALFLAAAAFIQLRLLCNLIDGMVAIEGGKQTRVGVLYNELPDRVSDAATLVGAGYAAMSEPVLGWLAALLAVMTAYIRAVGKAEGTGNDFCGPMAKPHRMAVMTLACVLSAAWPNAWPSAWTAWIPRSVVISSVPNGGTQHTSQQLHASFVSIGLLIIVVGALITCVRRVGRIARSLEAGQTR